MIAGARSRYNALVDDINSWIQGVCCQSDLFPYAVDDGKYQFILDDILDKKERTAAEQRVAAAHSAYCNLVGGTCDGIIDFPGTGPGNEILFVHLFGFSVLSNWHVYVDRIDGGKVGFSRQFWDDIVSRLDGLLADVIAERANV
jgi:hypothetical protein